MGFVLMETRGMFDPPPGMSPQTLAEQIPDELPLLKANVGVLCVSDRGMDFDFGVELMIAGIRDRVAGARS